MTTSSGNFELKDDVPDIKKNLISVSQLTENNSCIFEFSSEKFLIKDRRTGWILATGSRMGGLYALDKGLQALVALKFGKAPEGVWHQRLGHPQSKTFKYFNYKDVIDIDSRNKKPSVCASCQMGRSCRLPFSVNDKKSDIPLFKIHSEGACPGCF